MPPREQESTRGTSAPCGDALRVIVTGASSSCDSAGVAAMLSRAVKMAGVEPDSVRIVDAGSTLEGMRTAVSEGAWRFVVVAGTATPVVTAAFAMVKAVDQRHPGARIELLVTGKDESRAHATYLRVRGAAEWFLGREVGFAGAFVDLDAASADESDVADSMRRRATCASRAARVWAARLLAECSEGAWHDAAPSMN